jgi:uncharacterized protein (TIGR03067 family)
MRMTWQLPLLLAGVAWADAPKEDPGVADRKAMQGDWACVSMIQDGTEVPADDAQALFRTVKDDHYTVFHFRRAVGKGTFKVDATKNPRTIDFIPEGAPGGSKPLLGIYEWMGPDRYRVCYAPPGQERPADFSCKKGSQHTLAVWRREKE